MDSGTTDTRNPATAASTISSSAGTSRAFTWVRVVTTTCSPSLRSLLGNATQQIMSRSDAR